MDTRSFILHNSTENTYRKTTDRVLCTLLKVRNELVDIVKVGDDPNKLKTR